MSPGPCLPKSSDGDLQRGKPATSNSAASIRTASRYAGRAGHSPNLQHLKPANSKPPFQAAFHAELLTTSGEYGNNGQGFGARSRAKTLRPFAATPTRHVPSGVPGCDASGGIPPGEDGMDLEKDNFEEDNELAGLEEDDELGGDDVVETEEEELIIGDEGDEEPGEAPAPKAAKPAPKAAKSAAAKPAPKAAAKKAAPA